jgi:S-adenosylmethionine-diacylgycerolhomoserine-N-methlytransferase
MTDRPIDTAAHADAMDRMYRLTRHVYDATRKYYLLGRDRLIRRLDVPTRGSVLEIGCGTGRNLIAVARAYPTVRVYGVDISEEMLKTARAQITAAGLADRITVAQGDATSFDATATFGRADFDRVFFSYTLSMIPDWLGALTHAGTLSTIDGRFLAVDFGGCERLPGLFRRALWAWLKAFGVTPRLDLEAALAAAAQASGRRLAVDRPFGGYAQLFVMR